MDHHFSRSPLADRDLDLGGEASEFASWLFQNAYDLSGLAEWLGGSLWRARAERLCRTAGRGVVAPNAVRDLHGLLSLAYVSDPDLAESSLFALIDLDDPKVHLSCLAAESLSRGLASINGGRDCTRSPTSVSIVGEAA